LSSTGLSPSPGSVDWVFLPRAQPLRQRSLAAGSGSDGGADAVSSQVQCRVSAPLGTPTGPVLRPRLPLPLASGPTEALGTRLRPTLCTENSPLGEGAVLRRPLRLPACSSRPLPPRLSGLTLALTCCRKRERRRSGRCRQSGAVLGWVLRRASRRGGRLPYGPPAGSHPRPGVVAMPLALNAFGLECLWS
jgi:hypothetical protein